MKISFVLVFLMISVFASSQDMDSTGMSMPQPPSTAVKAPAQYTFYDLTSNFWSGAPAGIENKLPSIGFNVNMMYEFEIVKHNIAFSAGLAYSMQPVASNAFPVFELNAAGDDAEYTDLNAYPDSFSYEQNKFAFSYLDVPLEVRFRTTPKLGSKKFWLISPGFRGGLELKDFWKQELSGPFETSIKTKVANLPNVAPFHYGVSLRIIYYKFGLYGFYSLGSLFKDGKGPDVHTASIGITITPF